MSTTVRAAQRTSHSVSSNAGSRVKSLPIVLTLCWSSAVVLLASTANATPIYTITFNDPGNSYASFYPQISSNLLAAGLNWNRYLGGLPVSVDLEVRFDAAANRTGGASATNMFVGTNGTVNVLQEGAAAELRTGIDPNGLAADGIVTFNPTYLQNELWFDPNPLSRVDPVPANKTDAESVLIHELGHMWGFNGFLNRFTGQPPSDFESAYDQWVTFDGSNLYFTGPLAEAVYGGPVPLTSPISATEGFYMHLGNADLPAFFGPIIPGEQRPRGSLLNSRS